MNLSSESQILVDGYIDEVKVNLPNKIRSDIAVEIHSLIMDTLEDVVEDGEVDEQIVLKVLKELGSPIEIAGEYNPHNYVIGPRLYAPFWMTIRWTFILMTFFYLVSYSPGEKPLTH